MVTGRVGDASVDHLAAGWPGRRDGEALSLAVGWPAVLFEGFFGDGAGDEFEVQVPVRTWPLAVRSIRSRERVNRRGSSAR
jgi:hypothetical protein